MLKGILQPRVRSVGSAGSDRSNSPPTTQPELVQVPERAQVRVPAPERVRAQARVPGWEPEQVQGPELAQAREPGPVQAKRVRGPGSREPVRASPGPA